MSVSTKPSIEDLLRKIQPKPQAATASDDVDSKTRAELGYLDTQERIEDLTKKMEERGLRKQFSHRIFYFLCAYMTVVLTVLFFVGFKTRGFELSEKVLITLLASTTVDAIALFAIVTKYLFPSR